MATPRIVSETRFATVGVLGFSSRPAIPFVSDDDVIRRQAVQPFLKSIGRHATALTPATPRCQADP